MECVHSINEYFGSYIYGMVHTADASVPTKHSLLAATKTSLSYGNICWDVPVVWECNAFSIWRYGAFM